ncbi:MAG: hypothetical protein SGPRY_012775 [Prymnesium sp.]
MDEDDLLSEEDRAAKVPVQVDCGPSGEGKRKACKNCSCGLKEMLEAGDEGGGGEAPPAKSACGNCALGDAFRCANCPHLGKPAWENTEGEVKLAESNFNASAAAGESVKALAADKGGLVMLSSNDMDDF